MTLTQLRFFITVARLKSFTSAALILNISQSAVSHAISGLEKDLGVTLFVRKKNEISLTDVGQNILDKTQEIVGISEEIYQEAAAVKEFKKGILRIGSFGPSFSLKIFPIIMQHFRKKYPNIQVVLEEAEDQDIANWVRNRQVDIGALALPSDEFNITSLISDRLCVVLPKEHPLSLQETIDLQDVEQYPFILTEGTTAQIVMKLFNSHKIKPQILYRNVQLLSVITMVKSGEGISIIAELALPDIAHHYRENFTLRPLNIDFEREVVLISRNIQQLSPIAEAFITIADKLRDKGDFEALL